MIRSPNSMYSLISIQATPAPLGINQYLLLSIVAITIFGVSVGASLDERFGLAIDPRNQVVALTSLLIAPMPTHQPQLENSTPIIPQKETARCILIS